MPQGTPNSLGRAQQDSLLPGALAALSRSSRLQMLLSPGGTGTGLGPPRKLLTVSVWCLLASSLVNLRATHKKERERSRVLLRPLKSILQVHWPADHLPKSQQPPECHLELTDDKDFTLSFTSTGASPGLTQRRGCISTPWMNG